MTRDHLASELEALCDAGAVLTGAAAAPFTRRVEAAAVVAPPSAQSVAAVLAYCSKRGVPVLPAGAGTWLRDPVGGGDPVGGRGGTQVEGRDPLGGEPTERPVVVSTRRLRGILEHEPADLVIGVAAGTPLEDIQSHLRAHQQFLPLDPPVLPGSTVGAVIALGAAGPLRAGHGLPRDLVLGLEVVTGDGRLLRFGGRVVKNVAGYDCVRLFTGSRGSLGIITAAYIRVRGASARDVTLILQFPDGVTAGAVARDIATTVPADAVDVARNRDELCWDVVVRLMGSSDAVSSARDRIGRIAGESAAEVRPHEGPEAAAVWQSTAASEAGADTHITLHVPPASGPAALVQMSRSCPSDWSVGLHAADGVVRAWRSGQAAAAVAERGSAAVAHEAANVAVSFGGTVTCEREHRLREEAGHGSDRSADPPAEHVTTKAVVMIRRRIVAAFDPAGVLRAGEAMRAAGRELEEGVK